jgi:hypothetical protein
MGVNRQQQHNVLIYLTTLLKLGFVASPTEEIQLCQLFAEFKITTSDSGRFLGMDTEYNLVTGIFKMHISRGIPYWELVGS